MGRRLAHGVARQHPDLTTPPNWARPVVLAVLTLDGALSAVAGAFLLPLYVGSIPLPVSGLISGLLNVALIWAARQWTSSPRLGALPLWAWLATVVVMTVGGPGGDVVLGGYGVMQFAPVLFVVLGAGPPAFYSWWRTRAEA